MKVKAKDLTTIGSLVNEILDFDYATKSNGIEYFTEDSCLTLTKFVQEFNVVASEFKSKADVLKADDENLKVELKQKENDLITKHFKEDGTDEEKNEAVKVITEEKGKLEDWYKSEKDKINQNVESLTNEEYDLPSIRIEKLTNIPYPAKILSAINYFNLVD